MPVRVAIPSDATQLRDLAVSLSPFYLGSPNDQPPPWLSDTLTLSAFVKRLSSSDYLTYVYEEGGRVYGYISIEAGCHVYHLFVEERHHGRGIARMLWERVRENSQTTHYFLRSSLYAVPVYRRFGFRESGPVGQQGGVEYQPMELEIR